MNHRYHNTEKKEMKNLVCLRGVVAFHLKQKAWTPLDAARCEVKIEGFFCTLWRDSGFWDLGFVEGAVGLRRGEEIRF